MPSRTTRLALVGATVAALFLAAMPALAITGGERDEVHTTSGSSGSRHQKDGSAAPAR